MNNEPEQREESSLEEVPAPKERNSSTREKDVAVIDRHRDSRGADYAYVFVAMLVVLAGRMLSLRLADRHLGEQGFAEFSLARNVLALAFPVIFLGLGLALPRYIALSRDRAGGSPISFLHAALAIVAPSLLIFLVGANVFPHTLAKLLFREARYAYLVPPISVVLIGLSLHALCYSYLYGRLRFGRGSILEAVNGGIIPVAAFWFAGDTTASVLMWTGLLITGCSLAVLIPTLFGARPVAGEMVDRGKTLLAYGAPRVPGEFARQALVSTPAVLMTHLVGLGRTAGMVAFGCRLVVMAGSVLSPVSIILLPKASRMLARGERPALRKHALQMLRIGLLLGIAGTAAALIGMRLAIRLYLGAEYENLAGVMRIIVLAVPPYVVYVCLRSVIDAAHRRAINARNTYVALALYATVALVGYLTVGGFGPIMAGFLVGMYALGFLTWVEARRILNAEDKTEEQALDAESASHPQNRLD